LGLDAVTVRYGELAALDGVTLEVPRGEVTAVVGGDGAGKSTLLRVLAHRVVPLSGTVRSVPDRDLGYQPSTSGVRAGLTVDENIAFVGRSYGLSRAQIRERSEELLHRAGLEQARHRLGGNLSGGMRQKLGFLLAILHRPALVLLDEPSTGVDPVSRVELWRLISETAADRAAVLMATTYLDEAQRATGVVALDAGHVIAEGTPEQIIAAVPGSVQLVDDAAPPSSRSWRRGRARHEWTPTPPPSSGRLVECDLEDALIADTLARHAESGGAEGFGSETAPAAASVVAAVRREPGEVIARAESVTRRFGGHRAVDEVSIEVRAGEIVGLIGANGAGKTTLIRTLIGLDRPDEGRVELFGAAPSARSRPRLGYVPQGLGLYRSLSVDQNVAFTSRVYRSPRADLPTSLAAVRRDTVSQIGLGRQRQLAFTLALSHDPELLVLDEPTSGVDPLARARLWDIIHDQAASGRGILVTTHYLQEAEQCTRLVLLSRGRLLGSGSVEDLTAQTPAVVVRCENWQRAFAALGDAGLPVMLSGRDIRVAGHAVSEIRAALGGLDATVQTVPPTLEETMILLDRAR